MERFSFEEDKGDAMTDEIRTVIRELKEYAERQQAEADDPGSGSPTSVRRRARQAGRASGLMIAVRMLEDVAEREEERQFSG